jgi:iron complex transport system substrate-binding protein
MKKALFLLLALMMCVSMFACAAQPAEVAATEAPVATEAPATTEETAATTVQFTDSVGRTVELPKDITKIAVSGPLAQIVLFALCPDKLVGVASKWDAAAEQYLATEYYNLPELDSSTAARVS